MDYFKSGYTEQQLAEMRAANQRQEILEHKWYMCEMGNVVDEDAAALDYIQKGFAEKWRKGIEKFLNSFS